MTWTHARLVSSLLPVFVTQENVYQFLRERYMKPDVTYFAAHDFISSLNETYQLNRVRYDGVARVCLGVHLLYASTTSLFHVVDFLVKAKVLIHHWPELVKSHSNCVHVCLFRSCGCTHKCWLATWTPPPSVTFSSLVRNSGPPSIGN